MPTPRPHAGLASVVFLPHACPRRVAFTVNSIFERSAGRIRQRAANRILGTVLGAAWSCATIGVVLGINGGSWENR